MQREFRTRARLRLRRGASVLGLLYVAAAGAALAADPPKFLHNDPALALTPPSHPAGPAPAGSAPPNPDPHNLEGIWWTADFRPLLGPEIGVPPPLRPPYMGILERRIRDKNRGVPEADASTQCFPHGTPRVMESPYPIEIIETPGQITLLLEVQHNIRRLYLTNEHSPGLGASFLGDSIAHWEGDTLVVDTIGLNDDTFIDDEGSSHSEQQHVTERIRKIDGGARLEITSTIEDPLTLEKPYSYRSYYHWRPDVRPMEYVCEENNRNAPKGGITVAQ